MGVFKFFGSIFKSFLIVGLCLLGSLVFCVAMFDDPTSRTPTKVEVEVREQFRKELLGDDVEEIPAYLKEEMALYRDEIKSGTPGDISEKAKIIWRQRIKTLLGDSSYVIDDAFYDYIAIGKANRFVLFPGPGDGATEEYWDRIRKHFKKKFGRQFYENDNSWKEWEIWFIKNF